MRPGVVPASVGVFLREGESVIGCMYLISTPDGVGRVHVVGVMDGPAVPAVALSFPELLELAS